METSTDVKNNNPLAGYFRHPAIYLRLPSKGKFWPDGALNMPINGEIAVYPMTTKDEITLRTPDALLNGSGVVAVMQSCCPEIKDGWHTPSVDVDAILLAIRIATYGHTMDFDTVCPHCKEENTHGIDLRPILDSMVCPDYSEKIEFQDIKIKLKAQAYFNANKANMVQFEEQKIINTLNNADIPNEVKSIEIAKAMQNLADISIGTVASSTDYIELADGSIVSNQDHIREFYTNVENKLVKEIQSKLAGYNETTQIQPRDVECGECHSPYRVPMNFDYANFFGKGF